MVILLVCLSILFSHSWSVKLAHHITSFTPPGSRIIPLFSRQTPWQNLDGITFKGELNTGGVLKVYDFGPISCWILEILWDHMICLFEIKHRFRVITRNNTRCYYDCLFFKRNWEVVWCTSDIMLSSLSDTSTLSRLHALSDAC